MRKKGSQDSNAEKAKWDQHTMELFLKICLVEIMAGNRCGTHFNKIGEHAWAPSSGILPDSIQESQWFQLEKPFEFETSGRNEVVWDIDDLENNANVGLEHINLEETVDLKKELQETLQEQHGLESTRGITIEEMVALFSMVIAHGIRNRMIQEPFQHFGETISRLELKPMEKKKSSKGKVTKESLADLQNKMGRLTADVPADEKSLVKGEEKAKSGNLVSNENEIKTPQSTS
ncbi:transcription factor VOZ1 [Senna tora]|uniref:Transcription factor VOZ1 n=1 Tax=Senna tora TaxID=362788 RepID=A0A834VYR4_9FABA|nr:transcription factor VOZ1 [Senna tora]